VADDLAYADLGCYGGDIYTPHIDSLAETGISFSRFHTAPMCAPTRAMLLSGNDNHIAGMGKQSFRSTDFGYEGRLTDRIVPVPALLQDTGYFTCMTGKWHLGLEAESNPANKGFMQSFALLMGAGNHYTDQGLFKEMPVSPYTENGKEVKWKNGAYSTDVYTDKLIAFLDQNKEDNKPFFAFAAYTSPHWPLQVDESYWRNYEGRYDLGYEKLREERLNQLKEVGMLSPDAELPPLHAGIPSWESLSVEDQKKEARKMELYAGMVENLDANIGRLLDYLKEIGEYDNTLIVFMSDNGAAGDDFFRDSEYGPYIRAHFNEDYERMGQASSFISYGPSWAEAGSSPFNLFKGFATEGGMLAPLIISGPGIHPEQAISHDFLTVMDLAPTFYELAGTRYPERYKNKKVYPLKGTSLLPFLSGSADRIHSHKYVFGMEHYGNAMLRMGDWKILNTEIPLKEENFKLYHVSADLAEKHDLRKAAPEKYKELLEEWQHFADEIQLQVP
jgi:arylsulfatase